MRFTENYRLFSVEAGEPINPLEDSRRFLTIDRQLLGLFQVFGNGVIEGWNVTSGGGLTVTVSPGRGHVNFMSAVTTEARSVIGLASNATNYIYAQPVEQTRFTRDVNFFSSITLVANTQNRILLAKVTTNSSGVTDIDETVRNDISFIELIKSLINQHRHRGGPDNPSKIDLASEVIGQLPGFRVDGLDASKIVSGRIPAGRLPRLEHSDLLHSGILTHAQLDSFVRDLSASNVRLLGELSSANLLQLYLAMKHGWNEVDAYAMNMIAMIPGITPDLQSDLTNTTALFDRVNHAIQGVPALNGQLLTTTFRTTQDFNAAPVKVNIDIDEDTTSAFFKLVKPLSVTIVDSFDNVFSSNSEFPDWELETVASNNNSSFKSDSNEKVDGAFSAKLKLDQSMRVQVTRFFDASQDWTDFNELELQIETLSPDHGQIRFQVLGGTIALPTVLDDFVLLQTNETTTGFRRIVRDILSFERTTVIGIRLYTDTAIGWDLAPFQINIDSIKLNNNLFYKQTGSIRFRVQTPQKSKWAAVAWDATLNGGQVKARARTASNFSVMDQTSAVPFSPFFDLSGDSPNVSDNTSFEVELSLASSADKTGSPVVRSVTISFIASGAISGLTVDTTDEFLRATRLANAIVESPGDVLIKGRIDTGDYYYGQLHTVQQIDRFGTPIVGITGSMLPISPLQAIKTELTLRRTAIDGAASVHRLPDRTYLVADTLNDRVILFDQNGDVIKGLASNNARTEKDVYPLGAVYHQTDGILYINWSTNVSFDGTDLSKITIVGSGISITLSNTLDKLIRTQGANTNLDGSNILAILLSPAHSSELEDFLSNTSIKDSRIFLNIDPTAVKEQINSQNTNFATLVGPRGLPVFVGDIKFIPGIYRPVSVALTDSGNWLIGNAKPLLVSTDGTDPATGVGKSEVTSVIEVVPDTGEVVFSDDSADFSLITLGGAIEYSNGKYIAVAGITTDQNPPAATSSATSITSSLLGGTVQTDQTTTTTSPDGSSQTSTTTTSELSELNKYRGIVKIIEKASGLVVFQESTSDGTYAADVQLDEDENLVVVEKSISTGVDRGRVVKVDEDGNVFFQFGLNELTSPNDVRVLSGGNMVVST